MSITVHRAMLIMAGAAVLVWAPALAQADRNIQPDCAKIDDPTARLACYDDKNLGPGETAATPQREAPQGNGAPAAANRVAAPSRESAPPQASAGLPQRPTPEPTQPARMTPTVAAVAERGPGAYLLTLEDGAQWEFAEDMALTYRPPERGSRVEIERGVFGTYRMRFDGQQPVRVRRLR